MIVPFKDEYQRRLYQANQKILECYDLLDPEDEDYKEKLEALAKLQKEIASDYKNYGELENDEERVVHEKKSAKAGHILQIASLGLTAVTFFAGQFFKSRNFKTANKYEQENAYLTMSDRAAVNDALKEPEVKFWQFWKR